MMFVIFCLDVWMKQTRRAGSIDSGQVNSEVNLQFNPWSAKMRSKST